MIAIEVAGLRKSYEGVHALRGIDLSIAATGQIIGLLGPNGAGKTTFVEILEGLRTASSGSVSVLGLDPAQAPGALRARLGVQLQSTAFMQGLTVLETLQLYGALYPTLARLFVTVSGTLTWRFVAVSALFAKTATKCRVKVPDTVTLAKP